MADNLTFKTSEDNPNSPPTMQSYQYLFGAGGCRFCRQQVQNSHLRTGIQYIRQIICVKIIIKKGIGVYGFCRPESS